MSASLVGSEMCIRDSCLPSTPPRLPCRSCPPALWSKTLRARRSGVPHCCLLYTSDAADDM
eukprot:3837790-Alexandrium_andersonii.AAC.1